MKLMSKNGSNNYNVLNLLNPDTIICLFLSSMDFSKHFMIKLDTNPVMCRSVAFVVEISRPQTAR